MPGVSDVKRRIGSFERWVGVVKDGLDGKPHSLYKGEASAFHIFAKRFGFEFLSRTGAKKRGLVLRRGALPVVRCWYGSPINDFHDLYLVEQFRQVKPLASGVSAPLPRA